MKVFDVEKYKDELSSKSASFVKKELMVMEKKRNQAAGKMLDLENQYATISSDYAFVNRYLELKENLEKITDEQAKNAFKQEKDILKLERDFNKISARLQSDADFKQAFEKYGEFYIQRQDAISKIRVLEGEILTKNFSSPSLIKKLLPLTASLLAAASLGVGALVFLNEKATKSEVKEPVKTVQNGAKKTNASDKKNSATYTPEQPKKSDLMVFEDKIKSYSPDTQKAMQKAIIWLQKSNAFLKAVAKNDLSARTTAKIEMDVLKAAMQNLDNNVWLAVNDDVNRIYAAIDVQKPGADFDLSYAYRKLPEMYEKRVKVQKNPNIQLFQKWELHQF